jgi:hypothetical protein
MNKLPCAHHGQGRIFAVGGLSQHNEKVKSNWVAKRLIEAPGCASLERFCGTGSLRFKQGSGWDCSESEDRLQSRSGHLLDNQADG